MKTRSYLIAAAGILVLGACAPSAPVQPVPDVNAIRTSSAYTVVAEFTLTASVFTPTSSPPAETQTLEPATSTPTEEFTSDPTLAALGTPAALCDNLAFDLGTVDVTIPDGTPMTPGQEFVKTWRIRNTGSCAWGDGYELTYSYGERMNGQPASIVILAQILMIKVTRAVLLLTMTPSPSEQHLKRDRPAEACIRYCQQEPAKMPR